MATDVSKLDYDSILLSLKTYLKSQSEFADYNFEGSGMSVLLNLLAQTAHNDAYLANMIGNEMWLDSATMRGAAASSAALLNYTSRSTISARASVDLYITYQAPASQAQPAYLDVPRGTKFTTVINEKVYPFVLLHSVVAARVMGTTTYKCEAVELVQGKLMSFRYDVTTTDNKYPIVNQNVDLTTLQVFVKDTNYSTTQSEHLLAATVVGTDPKSLVYYLEENYEGFYQIRFGDGIFGRKIVPGNQVTLQYVISDGEACNFAKAFSYASSQYLNGTVSVATRTPTSSGSAREDIESIKLNAPRHYVAQDRAVSVEDYKSLIMQRFAIIEDITAWGGEEDNPPQYGKAMICLRPRTGYYVTPQLQDEIKTFLKKKNVTAIVPVISEATYLYINVNAVVKRAPSDIYSKKQVHDAVYAAVVDFGENTLGKFTRNLDHSRLTAAIDAANVTVVNNETRIQLEHRLKPTKTGIRNYIINYYNQIQTDGDKDVAVVSSSSFTFQGINAFLEDRRGTINIYTYVDGIKTVLFPNVGTVDYINGIVYLTSFYPEINGDEYIRILATPQNKNVEAKYTQILLINPTNVVVDVHE